MLFMLQFGCLGWNSHEAPEASPAAAEERVTDGFTHTAVLTRVGHTHRYLHFTVTSSVLGITTTCKP